MASAKKSIVESHNPPMFVTVLEDTAALGGLVIAALGVGLSHAFRAPVIDAVASILDGVLLMTMAVILVWEAHSLLVGEGARTSLLVDVERTLRADERIAALDGLHSLQLGPESVLLVPHARFADELAAPEVARVLFDFD